VRTGIDILGDLEQAKGYIEAAARAVESGMNIQKVSEILELTDDQIEKLKTRLDLKKEPV